MSLLEICRFIYDTPSSTALRESLYVFPIVEGIHVLALSMSVGLVMWFDLRLAGMILRHQRVSTVFGLIRPWMLGGFGIMFITGGMLFWAHAVRCYESPFFRAKLVLLFMAGINVAVYHLTIDRRQSEWDKSPIPPLQARIAGVMSLILWAAVIMVGRTMAYFL